MYDFFASEEDRLNLPSLVYTGALALLYVGLLVKFCLCCDHFPALRWNFRQRNFAHLNLILLLMLPMVIALNARARPDLMYGSLGLGVGFLLFFLCLRPLAQPAHNTLSMFNMFVLCSFTCHTILRSVLATNSHNFRIMGIHMLINCYLLLPLVVGSTLLALTISLCQWACTSKNKVNNT